MRSTVIVLRVNVPPPPDRVLELDIYTATARRMSAPKGWPSEDSFRRGPSEYVSLGVGTFFVAEF